MHIKQNVVVWLVLLILISVSVVATPTIPVWIIMFAIFPFIMIPYVIISIINLVVIYKNRYRNYTFQWLNGIFALSLSIIVFLLLWGMGIYPRTPLPTEFVFVYVTYRITLFVLLVNNIWHAIYLYKNEPESWNKKLLQRFNGIIIIVSIITWVLF